MLLSAARQPFRWPSAMVPAWIQPHARPIAYVSPSCCGSSWSRARSGPRCAAAMVFAAGAIAFVAAVVRLTVTPSGAQASAESAHPAA